MTPERISDATLNMLAEEAWEVFKQMPAASTPSSTLSKRASSRASRQVTSIQSENGLRL
jgi:hypothetical protein